MARTSIEGNTKVMAASAAVDTLGYGKVTIMVIGASAPGTVTVSVGETAACGTTATTTVIDPDNGEQSLAIASGNTVLSYIGGQRYIKVTATSGTPYILLSECIRTN